MPPSSGKGKEQSDWFAEFKKLNPASAPSPVREKSESSKETGKPDERRRYSRFEIDDCQATLYRDGLLTVFGVGKENRARSALDLSEGGVRFLTHERLAVGSKVRIVIEMERYKDQITATGEVRWCYQSGKNSDDFYAGVEFLDLPAGEKRKIAMMRDWFTSPQYRAVRDSKRRSKT
ncbi:MAG TPA: PilZ domain-containing protein [Planctomycetota bacterium]|nr:PilZ domain-containing protein [Planctomycetota bacterium]